MEKIYLLVLLLFSCFQECETENKFYAMSFGSRMALMA